MLRFVATYYSIFKSPFCVAIFLFSLSQREGRLDILKRKLFKLSNYAATSRRHLDLSLVITSCRVNSRWLTLDN